MIGSVSRMFGADDRLRLFYAVALLWLQLPIGAVHVAYDYVVPLLESHAPLLFSPSAQKAPRNKSNRDSGSSVYNRGGSSSGANTDANSSANSSGGGEERVAQFGSMLRLLSMSGVLSVERADTIREVTHHTNRCILKHMIFPSCYLMLYHMHTLSLFSF